MPVAPTKRLVGLGAAATMAATFASCSPAETSTGDVSTESSRQGTERSETSDQALVDGAYAVFSEPTDGEDTGIEDELVDLVEATPEGATIHGAMYTWTREPVAVALAEAQERGVDVHLAVDWQGTDGANADPGNDAITTLQDADLTELVLCNEGDEDSSACISSRTGSINHNKTFTFSQTGDMSDAVFVSSHNLTRSQVNNFNDAVVIHGDDQLYDGFVGYMTALLAEDKDDDFFNAPGGQIESGDGNVEAKFSPRADSDGDTDGEAATDTVVDILSEVTEGDGCKVDVAHAQFTPPREPVADELIRLGDAGCSVRVAAGPNLYDEIRDKFDATDAVDVRETDDDQDNEVHSKYMAIRGTIDGEADRAIVVAGSHNLNRLALRLHDETLITVELDEVVSAYESNFDLVWDQIG